MDNSEQVTLGKLRKEKRSFSDEIRQRAPWLFDASSLFYFLTFIFLLGIGWMAYSLITNSGTQLYWWDYQIQYTTFAYDFWDTWHHFFATGHFELYSAGTYLGTDNIGSNSYYGLFDPFLFVCYIFPRAWIPQTFALATVFKGVASAAAMRAYLRYLGVSENSSRLGAAAYAFCGYVTFMEGFPTFVSMAFCVPLVMFGIDRLIKERKPGWLIFGLFFMGLISFFFLVVICIWGVLYALWRYFWTLKDRTGKENASVMVLGVMGFALGILMSAWTLLPSLRESSLTGRNVSIGSAYLASLEAALRGDGLPPLGDLLKLSRYFPGEELRTLLQYVSRILAHLFEMVGDSPGRELQGLVGFFFPTCNYLYLPLMQSGYDSWTASLFCYTPIVILFFIALVSSVRRKEWSHLIAFALCAYLLFTDFAYFFFYAFSGDGYGRWYIVLVPLIIYFACQELDRLRQERKWVAPVGAAIATGLTVLTWILCETVLAGKNFMIDEPGPYWQSVYTVPAVFVENGITTSLLWEVYYEITLDIAVGSIIVFFRHRDWLWKALLGFVAVETVVAGNLSFIYGSSCSYEASYNGGAAYAAEATEVWSYISSFDGDSFYRAYMDNLPEQNSQEAFGYNGTSTFHSLFNYGLAPLTRYSHMTEAESVGQKFGSRYVSKSWSGYYGNKRFAFDLALSMKYYAIKNEGYGNCEAINYGADNVPFGSTLVYGDAATPFRVYENPYVEEIPFGHAVDHIYKANNRGLASNPDLDDFYSGTVSAPELLRNEETYLDGAIIDDADADKILQEGLGLDFESAPSYSSVKMKGVSYSSAIYTNKYLWWGPGDESGGHEGPTYFLTDPVTSIDTTPGSDYQADVDKYVLTPKSGTYFNSDPTGAYFLLKMNCDDYSSSIRAQKRTRVYFIGDKTLSDGTVAQNQLLCYEYQSMSTYMNRKVGYGGDVFGFYPEGRVRYIVFCAKDSDVLTAKFTYPAIYECERSVLEEETAKLASPEYALADVAYSPDRFTFTSAFSVPRLVVTSLGYDAGWQVTATDANGLVSHPGVYRLDGGFVGFVAPAGAVTYVMTYETPYLRFGVIASMGSFALFALYEGIAYWRKTKQGPKAPEGKGKPKK